MADKTEAAREERFQVIDAFRGIAALWVVLYHFILRYRFGDMAYFA